MIERWLGYDVDWSATASWAQLLAAIIALIVAWRISRAELTAQRKIAADDREQFAELVRGIGTAAAADIVKTANMLQSFNDVEALAYGDARLPPMATHVNALKGLDLNRMPNAKAAFAVMELRRLAGWADKNRDAALESYRKHDALDPFVDEGLTAWREMAQESETTLIEALREPNPAKLSKSSRLVRRGR